MCTIWQCVLLGYFFLLLLTCRHACACNFYFKAECKLLNNSISFSTHIGKNKALRGSVKFHRKGGKFEVFTCFGVLATISHPMPNLTLTASRVCHFTCLWLAPGPQAVKCPPFPSETPLQFVDSWQVNKRDQFVIKATIFHPVGLEIPGQFQQLLSSVPSYNHNQQWQ